MAVCPKTNAPSDSAAEKPTYHGPRKRRQLTLIAMARFYKANYVSGKLGR